MMVAELIAVFVPAGIASRLVNFSAAAGDVTRPKARCSGFVCVVVITIFCPTPVAFCVKTFMRSPKWP